MYSILVGLIFFIVFQSVKVDDTIFHYIRFLEIRKAITDSNYPNYMDYISIKEYDNTSNLFYPRYMLVPFVLLGAYKNNVFVDTYKLIFYKFLCLKFSYIPESSLKGW